jgi:hypothetical protein
VKSATEIADPELQAYPKQAAAFVGGFAWCRAVTQCQLAFAVAGILGVFRVDLEPGVGADPTVWVVVGDLPPAYLAFEPTDTWQDALDGYVSEMRVWVEAARTGGDVADLIPVNVPPTAEYAEQLVRRLDFIQRNLLDVEAESIEGDA